MTDLGRACVFVACPVIAGVVHLVPRVRRPVRPGARQDVVHIGRIADAFDCFSFFREGGLFVQVVIIPVQVCQALRNKLTL